MGESSKKTRDEAKERKVCYALGFAGGTIPTLLPAAIRMVSENHFPTWTYIVAVLLYGVLGLIVTVAYKESIRLKALTLGIAAPALLANTLAQTTKSSAVLGAVSWESKAYAESSHGNGETTVEISSQIPELTVTVESDDGTKAVSQPGSAHFPVPCGAKIRRLKIEAPTFEPLVISAPKCEKLFLKSAENTWSGFWQGLGVRNAPKFRFEQK